MDPIPQTAHQIAEPCALSLCSQLPHELAADCRRKVLALASTFNGAGKKDLWTRVFKAKADLTDVRWIFISTEPFGYIRASEGAEMVWTAWTIEAIEKDPFFEEVPQAQLDFTTHKLA